MISGRDTLLARVVVVFWLYVKLNDGVGYFFTCASAVLYRQMIQDELVSSDG